MSPPRQFIQARMQYFVCPQAGLGSTETRMLISLCDKRRCKERYGRLEKKDVNSMELLRLTNVESRSVWRATARQRAPRITLFAPGALVQADGEGPSSPFWLQSYFGQKATQYRQQNQLVGFPASFTLHLQKTRRAPVPRTRTD